MYHHVTPAPGLVTVSPETFAGQMQYLRAAGYSTLNAGQFLAFLQGRERLPRKSVLLTFDDGYLDNYVHAFPVLQQFGLRAVIFAVTGWLGDGPARVCAHEPGGPKPPPTPDHRTCLAAVRGGRADEVMLQWSEVRLMEASGLVEVHSHTHSHIRWDEKYANPAERLEALRHDLAKSRAQLRECLGKDSQHLCWPQGYFTLQYQQVARATGFKALYTTAKGANAAGSDPLRIARVVVKDRVGGWLASRLWIYRHSLTARLYSLVRGK
jgi:peptidoglycan/xylan/chitin deacetylase (PgdA/CDA1 family)